MLHFEQPQLTEEKQAKECAINNILPMPHHQELAKCPTKHATRCLAMTVHYTTCCHLFQNQGSQGTIANKFGIERKRFYCALTRKKYDVRRKPTKKEKAKWAAATMAPSKPKVAKQDTTQAEQAVVTTAPSKPKVAKQDTTEEDTTQPSEDTTTMDIDSDSLPDPFAPKEMTPKMSGTKEDQSAENIHQTASTPKIQLEFKKHHITSQRNLLQRNHPHGHATNNSPLMPKFGHCYIHTTAIVPTMYIQIMIKFMCTKSYSADHFNVKQFFFFF